MGLKDAVKKVKEKVQGMAGRPYIGIDMAAGEDMTAYAGQKDAQKPEEAPEGQQAENSVAETEKGQEGASGEAIDVLQEWLGRFPEEMQRKQEEMMEEFCQKHEIKMEELAAGLLKAAEQLKNAFEKVMENLIIPASEWLAEYFQKYFSDMDEWQLEKMKMSNNERRRRGLPMVRRQAHLRNVRNMRRRKRRK